MNFAGMFDLIESPRARNAWLVVALLTISCGHSSRTASADACERARGEWVGDDVESRGATPEALAVGRQVVVREHWWIGERQFESVQPSGRARETIEVRERSADRCRVELVLGSRRRAMDWTLRPDGRLRARGPAGLVTAVLRRPR